MAHAQIVKANAGDVSTGEVPIEELADRLGVHRAPGGVREDRIIKVDGMAVAPFHPTPAAEDCFGGLGRGRCSGVWCAS